MTLNITGAFSDFFNTTMLPELEDVILDKYNSKADKIPMCFNVSSMNGSVEHSDTVGSFPSAPQLNEGSSVQYYSFTQGFQKAYVPVKYGLGMMVTEELIDDDKFGLIAKLARSLGKSIFETRQIVAFNVFNNGFTTAGPDGVSLFNASHPLLGGGTDSNTASADLTIASLEAAIVAFADTRDDENKHISVSPSKLVVPPALRFDAQEILNSVLRSDTTNNATNAIKDDGIEIVVSEFLTDAGQWILLADKDEHDLQFKERRAPRVEGGFDFDTGSGKTKMTTRFDVGYNNWRGTYSAT